MSDRRAPDLPTLHQELLAAARALDLGLVGVEALRHGLARFGEAGGDWGVAEILRNGGWIDDETLLRWKVQGPDPSAATTDSRGADPSAGGAPTVPARGRPVRRPTVSARPGRYALAEPSVPPVAPTLPAGHSVVRSMQVRQSARRRVAVSPSEFSERSAGPNVFGGIAPFGPEFKYLLGREVARGGNGVVTLVYDNDISRRVALKTLKSGPDATAREIERFLEEVRVTGQLEHPNIVPVHELGRLPTGDVYFTMKLVEGRTLETVLRGIRKDAAGFRSHYGRPRLLNIVVQVCRAVAYAHAKGVVHRDLKPSNIMLGEYGEVLLMDWGLAKTRDPLGPDGTDVPDLVRTARGALDATQTLRGTIKGTPAYMAPEQARGDNDLVDARSDVYALGSILYECLTSSRPHDGRDPYQVIRKVVKNEIVPPRQRAPQAEIPEELEGIVLRCLGTRREDRYPSAQALADELDSFLEGTRRRQMAAQRVEEGQRFSARYQERVSTLEGRREAFRARRLTVLPWDDVSIKRPMWALRQELARAEVEATDTLDEAIVRFGQALAHDPDNRAARRGLAHLYWLRFRDAEERRDAADVRYFRKMVEQYDDGAYTERFRAGGLLTLTTDPPGAAVTLHRLEEVDLVRVPTAGQELPSAPLDRLPVELGSHLLALRGSTGPVVRFPIQVEREAHLDLRVPLPLADEIPEGWVFVPGGPCRVGGDDRAIAPLDPHVADVTGFAIQRFPVTLREYLDFINDLQGRDEVLAQFRVPRFHGGGGGLLTRGADGRYFLPAVDRNGDPVDPLFPVVGICWADAQAYALWRGERDGALYRLPAELEWEKAARGADARYHPWGDWFDAGLCKTEESRPRRPMLEAVGTFVQDCSPYGVRDLAGGVQEWCSDWFDRHRRLRVARGGAWNRPRQYARACSRHGEHEEQASDGIGFRLVRDLPERLRGWEGTG